MRGIFIYFSIIAMSILNPCKAVLNEGRPSRRLYLSIWTDKNAGGSATLTDYDNPDIKIEQDAEYWKHEEKTPEGKDKAFEKVGEVMLWDKKPGGYYFWVKLHTGNKEDERTTQCVLDMPDNENVLEGYTFINWWVGEDDNRLFGKPENTTVVCTLDGGFFD